MDNKTLVITVVVAIISAFVKEITSWLLSVGKNLAITNKLKEKVKQQFTINKITVALNLFVVIFFIWSLYTTLSDSEPLTKKSVFTIAFNLVLIAISWIRIENVMNNLTQQRQTNSEIQRKFTEYLQWSNEEDKKLIESLKKPKVENERNT